MINWMGASLRKWGWYSLILGAIAGIWGAFLGQGVSTTWGGAASGGMVALQGAALGLGVCPLLAAVEGLINRFWGRAARSAGVGAMLGVVLGGGGLWLIGWALGGAVTSGAVTGGAFTGGAVTGDVVPGAGVLGLGLDDPLVRWIALPVWLGILAGAGGWASGAGTGRMAKGIRRARVGLPAGIVLGVGVTGAAGALAAQPWVATAALAVWGGLVARLVYWGEKRFAKRWIRVLTGPGEDTFYPLTTPSVTLGKLESNDIPLPYYQEIFPFHCRLSWETDHYKIVDREQGGMVQVNYRQVQEQGLKPGDLVKLGTALLQYGEVDRK